MCFWSFYENSGSQLCFRFFLSIKGKSKLFDIKSQTHICVKLVSDSPPPPNLFEVQERLCFFSKGMHCLKNHLSLLMHKRLHKWGSISLAWVLLCMHNLDAVFMQSGPFVVLNCLQFEGCASSYIRWSPMPLISGEFDMWSWTSHSSPHCKWATNALHHWLLISRSLATFCFFSLFYILDLLSFFSPCCFFAGCWLLLKWNRSSDMLWNEFAWEWTEIPDRKRGAICLNMEANKRWEWQTIGLSVYLCLISMCTVPPTQLSFGEIWTCQLGLWTC